MIRHLVLFRFKPGTADADVSGLFAAIDELPQAIADITDVGHGANFSERSEGFTHAISMRLSDRAALAAFYEHPAHKALKTERIDPIVEAMLVADYAEGSSAGASKPDHAHKRAL